MVEPYATNRPRLSLPLRRQGALEDVGKDNGAYLGIVPIRIYGVSLSHYTVIRSPFDHRLVEVHDRVGEDCRGCQRDEVQAVVPAGFADLHQGERCRAILRK